MSESLYLTACGLCLALALLLQPAASLAAQADGTPQLIIEARLEPLNPTQASADPASHWQFQPQRLRLALLTSSWFSKAPQLPVLELPGVVVLQPRGFASNFSRRIKGRTFAGQAYEYLLYPQRTGLVEIPSLAVQLWPVSEQGQPLAARTLHSAPRAILVEPLPADGDVIFEESALVAEQISVTAQWQGEMGSDDQPLQSGDAINRQVEIKVPDLPGMLIPPLNVPAVPGTRLFRQPLAVDEQHQRGELLGRRVELLTWVLLEPGIVELPALRLVHWQSSREQWQHTELAGRTVQVGAGGRADNTDEIAERHWARWPLVVAIAVAVLAGIASWGYRIWLARRWPQLKHWLRGWVRPSRLPPLYPEKPESRRTE